MLLDDTVQAIYALAGDDPHVFAAIARDDKQAAEFWEDRHRLSAIAKRTSGFKMNEDVVLPMAQIPEFAHYLETLNVVAAADAYRFALQELSRLQGFPLEDPAFNEEFAFASHVAASDESNLDPELVDEEVARRAETWLLAQKERFPRLASASTASWNT